MNTTGLAVAMLKFDLGSFQIKLTIPFRDNSKWDVESLSLLLKIWNRSSFAVWENLNLLFEGKGFEWLRIQMFGQKSKRKYYKHFCTKT